MSLSLHIALFGEEHYARVIDDIDDRSDHMLPVMTHVRNMAIDIVEEQFDTEGKRSGDPWEQLSRDWKFRRGSAHPILVHGGDLFDEMISPINWTVSEDLVLFHARDEVEEYGRYHQSGTSRMPQRKPVDFTRWDKGKITRAISRWIMQGIL